jgi:hypothetical protein
VKNGLLGLKGDIIFKLTEPINREDDLKNFDMCHEMSIIKDMQLFKLLRFFLPILELKMDTHIVTIRSSFKGVHEAVHYIFQDV